MDILNTLPDIDILNEYLISDAGVLHMEEIKEWIAATFSDEKPFNDDTPGGELVDADGNVIEENEGEDELLQELIGQSKEANKEKPKFRLDDLLEELSAAMKEKDTVKQNLIKKLIADADKEGSLLFGLNLDESPENNRILAKPEGLPEIDLTEENNC
jgi:hypothetical protein